MIALNHSYNNPVEINVSNDSKMLLKFGKYSEVLRDRRTLE
jgi:hypothetical protein